MQHYATSEFERDFFKIYGGLLTYSKSLFCGAVFRQNKQTDERNSDSGHHYSKQTIEDLSCCGKMLLPCCNFSTFCIVDGK
jgi:hypothetical protein